MAGLNARLTAIEQQLARLEMIESHLLDLLLPQRKAFLRQPHAAPPPVVADDVKLLVNSVAALHGKLAAIHEKLPEPTPASPPVPVETFEEAHAAITDESPVAQSPEK